MLKNGFFTEKTSPYRPIGELYLGDGDLILASLTNDLKARVSCSLSKYVNFL